MRFVRLSLITLIVAIGCTEDTTPDARPETAGWDGSVRQWGTLREVMHGEIMEGQVRLADVTDEPHVVGIGAPHKLQGEIVIDEGVAWVARIGGGNAIETRRNSPDDSAVFLAIAKVPLWTKFSVNHDVSTDEFDNFIQQAMEGIGLHALATVPFVIDGEFPALELHVLNGQCPFAEVETKIVGAGPPLRITKNNARGRLVGFYSENGAGRITHHGTRTHVHALLDGEDGQLVGHVDEVSLKAGATVRVPVYRAEASE